MNITNIPLKNLKPYENNPRKNDDAVKYVAESIKEFGFKVPIVIDKNNVIVAGYSMEYDPRYVDVIVDRWEKFTGAKAVLLNK